jgi:Domain of unknown function (DUF4189)
MRGIVGPITLMAAIVFGLGSAVAAQNTAAPAQGAKEQATYGAIAYDEYSGKKGAAWNQPSYEQAQRAALKECDSEKCLLNTVEPHQCGALAKSNSERAWAGAERDSLEKARQQALERCQAHPKAGKCVVLVSGCNK